MVTAERITNQYTLLRTLVQSRHLCRPAKRLRERSLDKAVRSGCWEQELDADAEG